MLIIQLGRTTPVTRGVALDMTLSIVGIFALIQMGLVLFLLDHTAKSAERTLDVLEGMSQKIKSIEKR
jgi:hypothetical protein